MRNLSGVSGAWLKLKPRVFGAADQRMILASGINCATATRTKKRDGEKLLHAKQH